MNLGLNTVAGRLYRLSPLLARKFLDAEYDPYKDFEEDKFRASAWGTLSARLYALLTEEVVRCFAGSDFTAADLLFSRQPVTVYLRWHEADLLSLAPLIKFVWESLLSDLISTFDHAPDKAACQPVLLDIEEAGRTGIPNLAEHSSTVNGRGISLLVAIQALSQLDALYGPERAKTIRNNMDSQIYYRQAEFDTAEHLQRRLGYKSGFAVSESESKGEERSTGRSEREIALLPAQDILQMGDSEVILFHRNLPPIRAKRMDFRVYPALLTRRGMAPPRLLPLPRLSQAPGWAGEEGEESPSPWAVDPALLASRVPSGTGNTPGRKRHT